jgi:hypothetical protein
MLFQQIADRQRFIVNIKNGITPDYGPTYYEQLAAAEDDDMFKEIFADLQDVYDDTYSVADLRIIAFVRMNRQKDEAKALVAAAEAKEDKKEEEKAEEKKDNEKDKDASSLSAVSLSSGAASV